MREKRTSQVSIFESYADHEIGRELQAMSAWLDSHPEVLDWVAEDIRPPSQQPVGRKGLSLDAAVRCALLKQYRQLTYEELVFCLKDSISCQSFARLTEGWTPEKTALQGVIGRISAATWERLNRHLVLDAEKEGVENGRQVRIDSTVTDTPIHDPTDSSLLGDGVRVMVRLLYAAESLAGGHAMFFSDHRRRAKKRVREIFYIKGKDKKARLYKDLLGITRKTLNYVMFALNRTPEGVIDPVAWEAWRVEAQHYVPLIVQVIDQTERRVFQGEKVPAGEKIVSLFEEHSDIIVKGSRDIQYGHKINLSTGTSGLVLDVTIEAGNPADSERFLPLLDRLCDLYGRPPRQVAADGGYASKDNLKQAKERGVQDVAFHKKRGLAIEDMAKSPWVYRKLRNFRAGIEAGISRLKRRYGLSRCTWKGLAHFNAYVWSSVFAHNLVVFAQRQAAAT